MKVDISTLTRIYERRTYERFIRGAKVNLKGIGHRVNRLILLSAIDVERKELWRPEHFGKYHPCSVISCFDFKRIPIPSIIERSRKICEIEKIEIADDALFMIAKKADGSMRDAQSLLDQVLAYGKERLTLEDVLSIFGIVHTDVYNNIMHAISNKDATAIIQLLHDVLDKGNDIQELLNGILDYIRNILLLKVGIEIPVMSEATLKQMQDVGSKFTENELLYLMTLLVKTKTDIKNSNNPILVAEMSFVKLSKLSELQSLEEILNSIDDNESRTVRPTQEKRAAPVIKKDTSQPITSTEDVKSILEKEIEEEKPKIDKLTKEIVEADMEILLKKVIKEKAFVGNYLKNCILSNVSNNLVQYNVASQMPFNMLDQNKVEISEIYSNHFNLKIRVEFLLQKEQKEQVINNPTMDDVKRESPALADFIEKTDSIIN